MLRAAQRLEAQLGVSVAPKAPDRRAPVAGQPQASPWGPRPAPPSWNLDAAIASLSETWADAQLAQVRGGGSHLSIAPFFITHLLHLLHQQCDDESDTSCCARIRPCHTSAVESLNGEANFCRLLHSSRASVCSAPAACWCSARSCFACKDDTLALTHCGMFPVTADPCMGGAPDGAGGLAP